MSSWGPSGAFCKEHLNLRGHFRGHLRVHSRVHFREHFHERLRGSNFEVRVLSAVLIDARSKIDAVMAPKQEKHI